MTNPYRGMGKQGRLLDDDIECGGGRQDGAENWAGEGQREVGGEAAGFGAGVGVSAAGATSGADGSYPSAKCAEGWGTRWSEFSGLGSQFSGRRKVAFFFSSFLGR